MRELGLLLAVFLSFGLTACSNSNPELRQVFSQVNDLWVPASSQWQERLSVFVLATNADGLEEIAEFRLIHDKAKLAWTFTPATWTAVERTGETWLGANNLQMPEAEVPTGTWQAEVVTRAGLSSSVSFAVPPPLMAERVVVRPPVTLSAPASRTGLYRLDGFPVDLVIWAYGEDGKPLAQRNIATAQFSLASLANGVNPNLVRSLMFYSYDRTRGRGVEAGPFELK